MSRSNILKINSIFFLGFWVAIFLASCGGSGGGSTTTTTTPSSSTVSVSGEAVKGPVANATISIYELNADGSKGTLLKTTTTDANGAYSLSSVDVSSTACYWMEITGGSYTDEITGSTVAMGADDEMSTVECDLSGTDNVLAITPLTTMASKRVAVLALSGGTLKTMVSTANLGVAQQYQVDSITTTLPRDPTDATKMQTATRVQRNYGLILAGLAQAADTNGVRSIDYSAALADDMSDGIMDGNGQSGGITITRISSGTYTVKPTDGVTGIQTGIDNFIGSGRNKANLDNMKIAPTPMNIGLNTAGKIFVTSTVLPAFTEGQNGSATLKVSGGTPPYTWSLVAGSLPSGISIDPNTGVLSGQVSFLAGRSTMSISPPFTLRVTDANGNSSDVVLHLTVVQAPPTLSISCPSGTVGTAYSCTISATGGASPYHYVTEFSFPPLGLVLAPNGVISGTPSTLKSAPFKICAIDSVGASSCTTTTINMAQGFSGSWSGTCTLEGFPPVPASGGFSMNISSSGSVSGSFSGDDSGSISGSVSTLGSFSATGGSAGQASWSGTISGMNSGSLSGSGGWSSTISGATCSGSWSG